MIASSSIPSTSPPRIPRQGRAPIAADREAAVDAVASWAGPQAAGSTRRFLTATICNSNTRRAYNRALTRFVGWAAAQRLELSQVTPPDVAAHLGELAAQMRPPSVKLHLAALKHWFDTLVVSELLPYSPAHTVRGPRSDATGGKTPVMTADEARRLFAAIDGSTLTGARDRALLGVMLFSFGRIGAVLEMRGRDYSREGQGPTFVLHEKGGKFHRVSAHHKACEFLDTYLALAGLRDQPEALLWQGVRHGRLTGRRLTQDRVCKMVKERCRAAGLSDAFGNHSFRATGITLHREAGGDLAAAQRIAGHASIRTTQLYDRSREQLFRAEVERVQL